MTNINYSPLSQDYETITVYSKGQAYFEDFLSKNSEKMTKFESSLLNFGISSLFFLNRKTKTINLTVAKNNLAQAKELLSEEIEKSKQNIYFKEMTHISITRSYCILVGPGCKIEQIINLHDRVKYTIPGLEYKTRSYDVLKDLKNTFDYSFVSLEKNNQGSCDAIVYFNSKEQAEQAIKNLRAKPLQGMNGLIYEMVNSMEVLSKDNKIKVLIPKKLSYEDAAFIFSFYKDVVFHKVKTFAGSTEIIAAFKSFESADYFAKNFRVLIREKFGISASSASILSDGIPIPSCLHKYSKNIKKYINRICMRNSCSVSLNRKCSRIYCDFSKLSDEAKAGVMMLIKNETIKLPLII